MNKLYETNSYLKECEMRVLSLQSVGDTHRISVNQSIFFPEEGGQYADTGILEITELPKDYKGELKLGDIVRLLDGQINDGQITDGQINDGQIIDVQISDKEILYTIDNPVPEGTCLLGRLDWDKRFSRMQNHSGEHILTGVIHNKYGFNNVGFHLSDDSLVTLDLDGLLDYDRVIEMERVANEAIYANYPINDSYPDKEELKNIEYRSKIEIDGQVRLITIGDDDNTVDVCACCAPHVKNTGEVGIIKVISVINYKKGIQIGILCGSRALEYINSEHSMMTSVSRLLSTSSDKVEQIVRSQIDEIAQLKINLSSAIEANLVREIESMDNTEPGCLFTCENLTANNMKNIYNVLVRCFDGYVGIFVGDDESGWRYNAGGKNLDARELSKAMSAELNAKGGGSCEMVQGRVNATKAQIIDFFGGEKWQI